MEMKIAYKGKKKFVVTTRGHQLLVDQPIEDEGSDEGMTPPEIFVASLASCMGVYVLNYCKNIGINPNDMILSVEWEKATNPARLSYIKVDIKLPKIKAKEKEKAIIKVAEHCLVHNTINSPPQISINLIE
jgi:putative redox protein